MRKAITPILSTILLVMLVVAVSAGAWYWITNVQTNLQQGVGSSIEDQTNLGSYQFVIVGVICDSANDLVTLSVTNPGNTAIPSTESWTLIVSHLNGTTIDINNTFSSAIGELAAKNATSIEIYGINAIVSGLDYGIKATIGSGTSSTTTCTAI